MEPVFDTLLGLRRRRRAVARGEAGADFLAVHAAAELRERLETVQRRFPRAAALFGAPGHAAEAIRDSGKADEVLRVDVGTPCDDAAGESVPLAPESLDLAVSLLALQDVNDVPGMLVQLRRTLRPDGLMLAAFAGGGTLAELRECLLAAEAETRTGASPRVHPFTDVREAGALLQRAGFALPVTDAETLTVRYDDMFALIRDLRAMGATNTLLARSRRPATRKLFMRAAQLYAERFADPDGRIRATFSLIWLSGWAPHGSQQQPLRRGSATHALADFLNLKSDRG